MKVLKGLAILIFIVGLLCFLLSLFLLLTLKSQLQVWERLQQEGTAVASRISLTALRQRVIIDSLWIGCVGLASMISGYGIFRLKNWARRLWRGVLVFLAAVNLYYAVMEYLRQDLDWQGLLGYVMFGVVIAGLWVYFARRRTKNSFQLHGM